MDKKNSKMNNITDTMKKKQALVTIMPYNVSNYVSNHINNRFDLKL